MSQDAILIKNGTVVNTNGSLIGDVLVINGIISNIAREIQPPQGCEVIDASGRYVIPGGIDTSTKLEAGWLGMKPKDDFYHGTRAGISGGTTMVVDLVVPSRGQSPLSAFLDWKNRADKKVVCDYSLQIAITWWGPQVDADMEILVNEYGVSSFKMFMSGEYMLNDSELYHIMKKCNALKVLPVVQAENGLIIQENIHDALQNGVNGPEGHEWSHTENLEAEATNRACTIAENVGCPLCISPITSEAAAEIVLLWNKKAKFNIYGETMAGCLAATYIYNQNYDFERAAALLNSPPIRRKNSTPKALLTHLSTGILATVVSANCTFDKAQNESGKHDFRLIPEGVNGLEDRLSVVWDKGVETEILTISNFVAVTSTNAAKIFNFYPRKGVISVDSDADVVIWNSKLEKAISSRTHRHNNDTNIFEGLIVKGQPEFVIIRGKVCYRGGELFTVKGQGSYVPRVLSKYPETHIVSQDNGSAKPEAALPASSLEKVTKFIEPSHLNYQEKTWAIEAMKKICSKLNLSLLDLFKGYDQTDSKQISRSDFITILAKVCGVSILSYREIDSLMRGYGNGESIKYHQFLKACEYLFCANRTRN